MKEALHTYAPHRVIHQIQHVQYGVTLYAIDSRTLLLEWDNAEVNYKIGIREIEYVLDAIDQFVREDKVSMIVKTYAGILIHKDAIALLQSDVPSRYLNSVAFILKHATHRISINLYAKMHRRPIAVRGFMSEELAYNWLRKRQSYALKKN